MYLIESPRFISTADSLNTTVKDHEIEKGSAVYHPLNTLHRQYKPETSDRANFWIHAGYYAGPGRPTCLIYQKWQIGAGRAERWGRAERSRRSDRKGTYWLCLDVAERNARIFAHVKILVLLRGLQSTRCALCRGPDLCQR